MALGVAQLRLKVQQGGVSTVKRVTMHADDVKLLLHGACVHAW